MKCHVFYLCNLTTFISCLLISFHNVCTIFSIFLPFCAIFCCFDTVQRLFSGLVIKTPFFYCVLLYFTSSLLFQLGGLMGGQFDRIRAKANSVPIGAGNGPSFPIGKPFRPISFALIYFDLQNMGILLGAVCRNLDVLH